MRVSNARSARARALGSFSSREAWPYASMMPCRSWASCSQSSSRSKSPSWIAVRAVFASVSSQSFWLLTTKSRAGPGRSSNSVEAAVKGQPPGRLGEASHASQRSKSARTRRSPRGVASAGLITSSMKRREALSSAPAREVSFGLNWAKSPPFRGARAAARRPRGGALHAGFPADRLGLSAGILTSHAHDFPLDLIPSRIEVVSVPAPATTVFEHHVTDDEREMRVLSAAAPLGEADVPEDWRDAGLVLLAPVINEVDARLAAAFGEASVAAEAQGWLRGLGRDGAVRTVRWETATQALRSLQALFLSASDVRGQESAMTEWVQRVPIAVVTAGRDGALLYVNGERYEVRARPALEVDPTGAGDVFAATFLARYRRGADPWDAAEAATCAASLSVEGVGWSAVPDAAGLQAALKDYRMALP